MKKTDFCVTADYTIREVMQVFERNKERGVVVLGGEGKVCGFLSMGDIIYALLEGRNIYSRIGKICNPSFIYLQKKDFNKALELFKKRNISLIPIVDDKLQLVDVITAREMFEMVELK